MTARVLGPQSLLGSWVVQEEAQQLTTMQQRAGIIPGPLFLLLPQVLIQVLIQVLSWGADRLLR